MYLYGKLKRARTESLAKITPLLCSPKTYWIKDSLTFLISRNTSKGFRRAKFYFPCPVNRLRKTSNKNIKDGYKHASTNINWMSS